MSGQKEDLVWHMSCLGRKLISSAAVEYFWGYDDFERKLVFLFCHWLFQEGGNSSESSFALFYGKFRTCAPRVKVSHCIYLYFYCWKGDTVNLFIPNISLVSLHTVYHKLIIILVLRIWYWIEW